MLGIKVKHKFFGEGTIIEISGDYVVVEFPAKTSKFNYPDAFENFITAVDPEIQQKIIDVINTEKAAAEEKRLAEEAARKAAEEERRAAVVHTPKKKKTLDEMFAADYHAEKLARHPILTYQQVEDQFGIRISGFGRGINPTEKTVVLISAVKVESGSFVYHDRWTAEGEFIYSGEGARGDQTMTRGNLAIKDAAKDGKEIHLFVKFSPQEYYYQGIFELVDYTYEDDKDADGNIHKEYKFRFRKVSV